MKQYLNLAQSTGLWLSLGGFQEQYVPDPKRLQNCHVVVDNTGSIVSTYRKVHLFDVEVFNGPVLKETSFTAPGQEVGLCQSCGCLIDGVSLIGSVRDAMLCSRPPDHA